MAIRRHWDVQWGADWWISLGFHIDHTDPSITLHLPGIVICMGRCKQPGFRHSLWRLRYTGATHERGEDEIVAILHEGWRGWLGLAEFSLRRGTIPRAVSWIRGDFELTPDELEELSKIPPLSDEEKRELLASYTPPTPPIRVTPKGTQYVRSSDIFSSAAGKRELKKLRDADLTNRGNQE